jgi:L-ascorbate metabolism protein UlaG (beta-lactamase superfamily)
MRTPKLFFSAFAWILVASAGRLDAQSFEFSEAQLLTNHELVLKLSAPAGRAYRIEFARNPSEWAGLVTFATNVVTSLIHTDAGAPYVDARFYRAVQLTNAQVVFGDHLATTNGEVVIQPRNHATFVMEWNGKMIYVDPVPTASYSGLPKADLVLISHTHTDHFNTNTIDAVKGSNPIIIAPQTAYNGLTGAQKSQAIVLGYGESTNVLGMNVEAVYAYNSYHSPLGFGNGYVVTIGGKRIYISGDTGNSPELRALTNIDVAFVCMNQPYTLTVSDATNVVRAIQPKVVYPYHYRDSNGSTANAASFKQRLGTDLPIEVRLRKWY